jgi:pyruvate/2-oxoglutarate dehydrogenase complex dihydrolipoamide dehydrogenase (E3) component
LTPEYDLCVIGGGAAGLVAAAGAAALGAKVVLVEKHRLGGDCLWTGCVPSKALLASARVAHLLRAGARYGLPPSDAPVALPAVMERVRQVIRAIEPNDSPERFRALGVEVVFGAGRFTAPDRFEVDGRAIAARRFVLATGSRPAAPAIPGLDTVPYLTNETVFELSEPLASLIVLGAGPIGMELAQAFARLGTQVTVVETAAAALGREDRELAALLVERLEQDGVRFHLGAKVLRAEGGGAARIAIERPAGGKRETLEAARLLVAAGRSANTEDLGLEAAGVALANGRVQVDARLRTSNPCIYACGDVIGRFPFTHMAEHQAGVVLRNALFRFPAKAETRVVPWCTFTDPELARVGLSEDEARARNLPHAVYRFPFADLDRAQAEGETAGLVKLVADPRGRLLGAAILGPQAGELIHEYVLALTHRMKLSDISRTIHVYPTLAQANRRAADLAFKAALTPGRKRLLRWLFRLRGPE